MNSVPTTSATKLRESLAIVLEAEERGAPLEEVAAERRDVIRRGLETVPDLAGGPTENRGQHPSRSDMQKFAR